jgi:gamma-glutamyltranspeptidase/glutathione hydrolase
MPTETGRTRRSRISVQNPNNLDCTSVRLYALGMRGAVAAGNRHTAQAGGWALARGGSAVDALVAAALTGFVAEGPLTGPAGGGFVLLREAGREPTLLDCFFAVPSGSREAMDEVVIDFGDSAQVFYLGPSSVAVPGVVAGLAEAHARQGRLPWGDLFGPALELAATGVEMDGPQRFLLGILVPILERTDEGCAVYGSRVRAETSVMVPALERLRDIGAAAVAEILPERAADIASYRVIERQPLEAVYHGLRVVTCPPPSMGGKIIAGGLSELDAREPPTGEPLAVTLVDALLAGYGGTARLAPLTGTTHVSVVDGDGNAAALSSTLGSGSGVLSHGFEHNNMLGELDVIGVVERQAGERLPSMMAPTLVLDSDVPRLVVGSAGSVRLAGAILQTIYHVVAGGLSVDKAIDHPRLHVEDGTVQLEGGWPAETSAQLERAGLTVNAWADRNLYFGGASAVERDPEGRLTAAGDPRRGGHGVVVA